MSLREGGKFSETWQARAQGETSYLHWTRGEPETQVQLAFRSHWLLFQELIAEHPGQGRRCIELGCGRGTISMYFADAGWDCTLVDIAPPVLETAERAFVEAGLQAHFLQADAMSTGLEANSYDVCVSIGLLEHMPDLKGALAEQVRLLRKDGVLLAYVVPEHNAEVQRRWDWLNDILRLYMARAERSETAPLPKPDLYRSAANSSVYLELLAGMPLRGVTVSGVYPLPMLSPSIDFPFTLNPPEVERRLTAHFRDLLRQRAKETGRNPWLCDEAYGQAFLVWGRKA